MNMDRRTFLKGVLVAGTSAIALASLLPKTSITALDLSDSAWVVDAQAGPVTVILPTVYRGWPITIKNTSDTNALTIQNGGETFIIPAGTYDFMTFEANGDAWRRAA